MFFVYILRSKSFGTYYVGSCDDVPIRLKRHNQGLVKSTKSKIPWVLVHKEDFQSRNEARSREMQIKSWKKRSAIEKLQKHF